MDGDMRYRSVFEDPTDPDPDVEIFAADFDDTPPPERPRHCRDGERLAPGEYFCGPQCRDIPAEWL